MSVREKKLIGTIMAARTKVATTFGIGLAIAAVVAALSALSTIPVQSVNAQDGVAYVTDYSPGTFILSCEEKDDKLDCGTFEFKADKTEVKTETLQCEYKEGEELPPECPEDPPRIIGPAP